jgi:hypothetical protein
MGVGASLMLLDTTSSTPQAEAARKLIASGKIETYTPAEPPAGGVKRKAEEGAGAGAGAGAAAAGAGGGKAAVGPGAGKGAGAGAGAAKKKK